MSPYVVAILIGLATIVSACMPTTQQPSVDARQTTVTFLISGDPADESAYRTLADRFTAANPDVHIDLLNIPSMGDFRRRLAADFAAGTPPDIFLINYRRYGPFVAGGAIEPIEPYLAQSEQIHSEEFYAQALAAFTWQDLLMCLPQNMSSPQRPVAARRSFRWLYEPSPRASRRSIVLRVSTSAPAPTIIGPCVCA